MNERVSHTSETAATMQQDVWEEGLAYIRQPTIHGAEITFVAESNLWTVGLEGGVARRITSSSAIHSCPRYSPDGQFIAFSSADEGPPAVYVMPAQGGAAKRLTYYGRPCFVVGWSTDGLSVIFRLPGYEGFRAWSLASVPVSGGAITPLPYGRADGIAYHPDGDLVAVHRHAHDPAWWKRYQGGRAGRIWIHRKSTGEFTELEGGPRTDASPMWIGQRLYFLSDQDGMGDLWCAGADGTGRRRITSNTEFFARTPQAHGSRIVYAKGARLYLLDMGDEDPTPHEIAVSVFGHSLADRRKLIDVSRSLEAWAPNVDATETLLTVRGRIARVPNWHGPSRVIADIDGLRFRDANWLGADGDIVAIADMDGEDHVVRIPAGGVVLDARSVDSLGHVGRRIRSIVPSPDGKRVALLDQGRGLHVIDVEAGETTLADDAGGLWVQSAAWSPCSTWLAFTRKITWWEAELCVWGASDGEVRHVGSREYSDHSPAWDPAGRFLAFLSSRHRDPFWSQLEHEFSFPAATRAYAIMLRKGDAPPFGADVVPPEEAPERVTEPIEIDFDALEQRTVALPFESATYHRIGCSTKGVAVLRAPLEGRIKGESRTGSRAHEPVNEILGFDYIDRKVRTLVPKANDWRESSDGTKWMVQIGKRYRVLPFASGKPDAKGSGDDDHLSPRSGWTSVDGVAIEADPRTEYRQMFLEAWRLQRDHFYDERMAGVDWDGCRARYLPLVDRVRTRDEMEDLLWELQGELGTSHAYAMGGDMPVARNYSVGQLGCDFAFDAASKGYRITRIYTGDAWAEGAHSPLVGPGKQVEEGDLLLAVDGRAVGPEHAPGRWLLGRVGQQVVLRVASDPSGADARDVVVKPIADETELRYREWVNANQKRVAEATGGEIGYIHIPDMGVPGAVEFHRHFGWQVERCRGFVVDARFNGGGNISALLLAKLQRKIVGWSVSRWGVPRTYPAQAPRGPIVVLTNENAGSDGDIFSQAVKSVGLGPLIGKRSWGGVVGIDRAKMLVDHGYTTQPEYAFWFNETGWGVENHGVDPDIVVDRTPEDASQGKDPQLERAISEALDRLASAPPQPPDLGPRPDRSYDPGA